MSTRGLEALDRILNRGGDADDVLRSAVAVLVDEPGIAWAGIAFQEEGSLTVGPQAGEPDESRRIRTQVLYKDAPVGELWVDGEADTAFLERFALLISQHVLIGWDTQGERWDP
jgi:hypothetical protein